MPITFSEHNPQTLEEAVDVLTADLNDEERTDIARYEPEAFHDSVGRKMRNEWGLWVEDSPLRLDMASRFHLTHADDVSGVILAAMFARVRGEYFDAMVKAEEYHQYWANCPTRG